MISTVTRGLSLIIHLRMSSFFACVEIETRTDNPLLKL